jgi:hypothetical protein
MKSNVRHHYAFKSGYTYFPSSQYRFERSLGVKFESMSEIQVAWEVIRNGLWPYILYFNHFFA